MRYISMFSGIEAASAAWHPLGWKAVAFAEVEPFPSAVLAHHYPTVPNVGDMTAHDWSRYAGQVDVVVGGPPCQAFSVAGLRKSLDDDRGNLSLQFAKAIYAIRPTWAVIENVPGWLSTKDNAFGCMLAALVGADAPLHSPLERGRWPDAGMASGPVCRVAWRILDAQYLGLAQRRRRVFIVAGFGDGADPSAVLFERKSVCRNSPPSREARASVAALTANGAGTCGADDNQGQPGHLIASTGDVAHCLNAGGMGRQDYETKTLIAHTLRGEGFDASEDGTGRGIPLVPELYSIMPMNSGRDYKARKVDVAQPLMTAPVGGNQGGDFVVQSAYSIRTANTSSNGWGVQEEVTHTLDRAAPPAVAFAQNTRDEVRLIGGDGQIAGALAAEAGMKQQTYVATSAVRRLTPTECERLMGFPDGYTNVPYRGKKAADGPRYRAIGNSMAVPCMGWIGERIAMVEQVRMADDSGPKTKAFGLAFDG